MRLSSAQMQLLFPLVLVCPDFSLAHHSSHGFAACFLFTHVVFPFKFLQLQIWAIHGGFLDLLLNSNVRNLGQKTLALRPSVRGRMSQMSGMEGTGLG